MGRATANGFSKNQGCLEFAAVSGSLLAQRRVDSVRGVGLGAVLQRGDDGSLRAVAYASYSLKPAEQRYAQIEKEAFSTAWACEKFHDYLFGLPQFFVYTDHKPLVPLLGVEKRLDELPPRV